MRILIADDETISRTLLRRSVEHLGHECTAAADGLEAWQKLQERDFDVLISDWMMPGMNGLELCRKVRESRQGAYLYFILLTALDGKDSFLEGMEAGADDYLTKPLDRDSLQARLIAAKRITSLHQQLVHQKAELEKLNDYLYRCGRVDALTGVGNRLRMEEDLASLVARVQRYGQKYAFGLCDVDNFKKYNDMYGHGAGDECLREVARMLQKQCRQGDEVYRYGGEEFLVVLPEQTAETAVIAMDRMRGAVEKLKIPHQGNPPGVVTFSCGISALAPFETKTTEAALGEADQGLYAAKRTGRNRVVIFDPQAAE